MDREGTSKDRQGKGPVNLGDILREAIPGQARAAGGGLPAGPATPPQEGNRVQAILKERGAAEVRRADTEFYSELSTNRYPFASLWSKDTGRPGKIVVRSSVPAGESESRFEWIVQTGDPVKTHYGEEVGGLPGPFDRRVFRALEKIVLGRTIRKGTPLQNPQELETKEILDLLGITDQGTNYRAVVRALARLSSITIHCSGQAGPARPKTDGRPRVGVAQGLTFHLIDMIRWAGTVDPKDGLVVPRTRIYFGEGYVQKVNAFEVRPLDWDLWMALQARPLAQRLFEILELKFFGLEKSPYASFSYPLLCQLLPTRPQRKGLAIQVLGNAHEALREVIVSRAGGRKELWRILDLAEWDWGGEEPQIRYFPDRSYLRELHARKTPEFDPRALELAQEFKDPDSVAFYQLVVRNVEWSYIQAARTEVRTNSRVAMPGRYFTATLEKILRGVGQPVPWGSGSA